MVNNEIFLSVLIVICCLAEDIQKLPLQGVGGLKLLPEPRHRNIHLLPIFRNGAARNIIAGIF